MPPLALYVHWPFCLSKCPYCDFNSHVRREIDTAVWAEALACDLAHEAALLPGRQVGSLFFGGGTPSLMPPTLVAGLIEQAERLFGFAPGIEITLEGNPSSIEAANYAGLASAGVNRVSLGVQSLDDAALRMLGRLHSAAEALAAVEIAQRHFARVSIDLIYARPGQGDSQWDGELSRALALGTEHLSLYQLTIEPGTRFATEVRRGALTPLDDDAAADLFALTQERTAAAGLPAYEISNHARTGAESRHNLAYWRYQDYVGIGPGAHGRRARMAVMRHKKPENYLAAIGARGHGIAEERVLPPQEQATEALLMGLRLAEGIDLPALADRFGFHPGALIDRGKLHLHEAQGLVARRGERLVVTPQGMPLLDALLPELVALQPEPA
ncbi:radical SAM family heme chaperone HemW [Qipengyuania sediminis]|uniref:radical SAM family heme chaperone HemW n=1 Tax=Qipengyuania sediminis TaxID=1532023 RepID=UPI00105A6871|nr:radical SAM family heme chaperone HemW [Qipengyuania sediminis]